MAKPKTKSTTDESIELPLDGVSKENNESSKETDKVPVVDMMEETIDTVKGRIVKLASHRAIWRSEKKGISLSWFSGNITARVPATLEKIELEQVVNALRTGSLIFVEKEESALPTTYTYDNSADALKARLFLDTPNIDTFKKELYTIRSPEFLSKCISIYEAEYRSTPRLDLLKDHLKKL